MPIVLSDFPVEDTLNKSHAPPVSDLLRDHGAVRALVALAGASELLMRGPTPDMALALQHIGTALDYRAVAVWRHNPDKPGCYKVHARWMADDHPSPDAVCTQQIGIFDAHLALARGETVALYRKEATTEQQILFRAFPDEAILMVPIQGQERMWGAAIFAVVIGDERTWSEPELACLRTVAAVCGGAVQREQDRQRTERLERELLQQTHREHLATLATGVAHDVNNLLAVVQAGVDMLALRWGDEAASELESLEGAITAASNVVDKLYSYSGHDERSDTVIEVEVLMDRIRSLFQQRVPDTVELVVQCAAELPAVHGDKTQLMQVLSNLVINAIEAMEDRSGAIRITAQPLVIRERLGLLWQVSDQGPGLPPELLERLFQPYVTTKGPGHGIGLASSAAIVHSHGGSIRAHNQADGGACVEVWLPAATPQVPAPGA